MARRGSTLGVVAALTSLLLAACSTSDDDAGGAAATTIPVTTVAATTDAPTTTNAPPTTATPSTTIDPANELAAAVEADFLNAFEALYAAIQDPADDAKLASALDWHLGANREFIAEQLERYRINGWVAQPNPNVEAAVKIETPPVLIEPSTDVAELRACEIDSWIVVEPGAGPDGSDALVNDELNTYRSTYFVRRVGGQWRIEGSSLIGSWLGLETCPAQ